MWTAMPKATRGFYAVARGRAPGIYLDWKDCEAQVLNFGGAKYKKFLNAADAELWIHQNAGRHHAQQETVTRASAAPTSSASALGAQDTFSPTVTAASIPAHALGLPTGPSESRAEGASASVQPATPVVPRSISQHSAHLVAMFNETNSPAPVSSTEMMIVYTDGSCRGSGKPGAIAGVGVWWGPNDPRNISERCPGNQTNNRAELIAIIRVLETASSDRPLVIRSDSEYSINCMTKWFSGWKRRGWRKSDGSPVQNLPVVQYLDILLEERRDVLHQSVKFEKVLAHSGEVGNEAVDTLAKQGTALPPLPERDWEDLIQQTRARISQQSSPTVAFKGVTRTTSSAPQPTAAATRPSSKLSSPMGNGTLESRASVAVTTPQVVPRAREVIPLPAHQVRMPAVLDTGSSQVYGRTDVRIPQRELEVYAMCLLNDDDLLREATEEGICA